MYVNLIPVQLQRQLLVRRCIARWIGPWVICLLAGGFFCGVRGLQLLRAQRELADAELTCVGLRLIVAENLKLEQELATASKRVSELANLAPDDRALASLSLVSACVQATSGRAQIEQFQLHGLADALQSADSGKSAATATSTATSILRGVALDDEGVAAFVEALRSSPVTTSAELQSTSEFQVNGVEGRRFEVMCRH